MSHSWLIIGLVTRLTRRLSLDEQELLTLPEHLSSPPVISGVRVTRSLVLCVCFEIVVCPFVLFILATVLSVLLRFTASDYPYDIFKLFTLKRSKGDEKCTSNGKSNDSHSSIIYLGRRPYASVCQVYR